MSLQKVAVVTGANRGIGFATVRALLEKFDGAVYLTSRNKERGEEAVKALCSEGLKPRFHILDTSEKTSIHSIRDYMVNNYGGVDIFIHNAGIMYKRDDPTPYAERVKTTVKTNYCDTVEVCSAFLPIIKSEGRLVILSSGLSLIALQGCRDDVQSFFSSNNLTVDDLNAKMEEFVEAAQSGTVAEKGFDDHAYGMSKLGVNVLTRILGRRAGDFGKKNILVNCCCPGWVRTAMGGDNATFSPDHGAKIPLMLAMLPEGSTEPNGEFYKRRQHIKWY